jgi:hypothetical protein
MEYLSSFNHSSNRGYCANAPTLIWPFLLFRAFLYILLSFCGSLTYYLYCTAEKSIVQGGKVARPHH